MALNTNDLKLFGLDLRVVAQEFVHAWHNLQHLPVLAWLKPSLPVTVVWPNGKTTLWAGSGTVLPPHPQDEENPVSPTASTPPKILFSAWVVPEELLLRKNLTLPVAALDDLDAAAALDAQNASPFPAADLLFAHQVQSQTDEALVVELVMASRRSVQAYLDKALQTQQASEAPAGTPSPEVWAVSASGQPMVLPGFGEAARARKILLNQRFNQFLLVCVLLILAAMAVTPTLKLRERALEAVQRYTTLHQEAAPAMQKREALIHAADGVSDLKEILGERMDSLQVMAWLTEALPDDTSVLNLQVQGLKVTITGQTANAAALMQRLSAEPRLRDVKAPSPAVRPPGATKENYTIEFYLVLPPPTEEQVKAGSSLTPAPVVTPVPSSPSPSASVPPAVASPAQADKPTAPTAAQTPIAVTPPVAESPPQSPVQPSNRPASSRFTFGGGSVTPPSAPKATP